MLSNQVPNAVKFLTRYAVLCSWKRCPALFAQELSWLCGRLYCPRLLCIVRIHDAIPVISHCDVGDVEAEPACKKVGGGVRV